MTKAPQKPKLTESRAQSLAALLEWVPEAAAEDGKAAAGLQYLRALVAWRTAEETKARLADIQRAKALTPSGMVLYTGRGRGRRKGDKRLS